MATIRIYSASGDYNGHDVDIVFYPASGGGPTTIATGVQLPYFWTTNYYFGSFDFTFHGELEGQICNLTIIEPTATPTPTPTATIDFCIDCPEGYVWTHIGNGICSSIDVVSATPPTSPYTAFTRTYFEYSMSGTSIYQTGWNINGTGTEQVHLNTANVWKNTNNTNGPLNRTGLWANLDTADPIDYPLQTWLGFNACITGFTGGLYYVGIGADNEFRLEVDGVVVLDTFANSGLGETDKFRTWHVYPITLTAGDHIIGLYGYNLLGNQTNPAGFGCEIYQNTLSELTGATTTNDLNIVFTSTDFIGEIIPVVKDVNGVYLSSGYTCPSGYEYAQCDGNCWKIIYCPESTPTPTPTSTDVPPTPTIPPPTPTPTVDCEFNVDVDIIVATPTPTPSPTATPIPTETPTPTPTPTTNCEFNVDVDVIVATPTPTPSPTATPIPTETPTPTPTPTVNCDFGVDVDIVYPTPTPSPSPTETPTPTPTPTTDCVFEGEVSLPLVVDENTKINIFFDSSGSMNSTLSPLVTMRDTILRDCLVQFYNNDYTKYDNLVTITQSPTERTFDFLATTSGTTVGVTKVINLVFQDESSLYGADQPTFNTAVRTGTYDTDMSTLRNVLSTVPYNTYYRAVIFRVNTGPNSYDGFRQFINAVLNGTGAYSGTNGLSDKSEITRVEYVNPGSTAQYYADQIITALNTLGYNLNLCSGS